MSRKNIILVVVIVIAVGGAIFVLYKGFFGSSEAPVVEPVSGVGTALPTATSPGAVPDNLNPATDGTTAASVPTPNVVPAATAGKILPLGTKFDLSLIKKYNADGKLFNYPKVNVDEIGPILGDIVSKFQ